jgi:lipopolysaccharide export system protein LptC
MASRQPSHFGATPIYTARQLAALPGGRQDHLVAVLRWLLPALAFALLAVIVIWPLSSGQEFSFLLAKDKVAMSPDRMRIDQALYRGQTADRQKFEIRAAGAVQRTSAVPIVELTKLSAYIAQTQGPATVSAPSGRYDLDKNLLEVDGPLTVLSAAGYSLTSGKISVSLTDRTIASDQPVSGVLPIGKFSGDRLRADAAGRVVVISGHVRMHITPARRK